MYFNYWKMICKTVVVLAFAVGVLASNTFKEICKKNGAEEDKADEVIKAASNFTLCLSEISDPDTLMMEFSNAKSNGSMKLFVKKYCAKSSQAKKCFHELYVGIAPCMDPAARNNLTVVNKGNDDLIDFLCNDDGSRIALFFEEGGIECVRQKSGPLQECVKELQGVQSDIFSSFNLLQRGCPMLEELQHCVVNTLRGCPTMVAADLAESVLIFGRKTNSCPV